MSILEQTLPASFLGVPLVVLTASITGGIKHAKHEYPGGSNQIIENLGAKQPSFSFSAVIHNDPDTDNYKSKRNALLTILSSGSKGTLIHPIQGRVDNVKAIDWTLIEDFSSLGSASININFEIDLEQSVPTIAFNSQSQVDSARDASITILTTKLADNFGSSIASNILDSVAQVNSLVEAFTEQTELFTVGSDKVDEFAEQLSNISENTVALVQAPLDLAQSVESLFETTASMFVTLETTFEVLRGFFDFNDDNDIATTTAIQVERGHC